MNESAETQNDIGQTVAQEDIEQDGNGQMRPIWYFVGVILAVIGGLVVISGVMNLVTPPPEPTVLAHLHVNLWWGLIITIAGVAMWLTNRRIES